MRYAIISDIHSNLEALDVVRLEIERIKPDVVICLGDIVGYGASPNECVEMVMEIADVCIAGNHDWGVIGKTDLSYFNRYAREAALWTIRNIQPSARQYLEGLDLAHSMKGHLRFVHATPGDPDSWNYIFTTADVIRESRRFDEKICFVGHSHVPCIIEIQKDQKITVLYGSSEIKEDCRYIVNVGSVGQPRDGDPRACLCIYEGDRVRIERFEYDKELARKKIIEAGLPSILGDRLLWGE